VHWLGKCIQECLELTVKIYFLLILRGPYHVGSQVNAQNGDGVQGEWDAGEYEEYEWRNFRDVGRQRVSYGLFQVVKYESP